MSNINPRWGDWAKAPAPIQDSEIVSVGSCDVVVIGAGISGTACALRAAQNGLKVAVLEKNHTWSGRGGNIGVPNSTYLKSRGYENDVDEVTREWVKRCASRCDESLVRMFVLHGGEAMDWLMDILLRPEYGCRPEIQGALYHQDTYREIYGSHRFFDGPMAKKGMRAGGADAVNAMYCESVKLGVEYHFNCPACELVKENGRVTGVIGKSDEGYIKIYATKGVVIATGDIGGNQDMCEDLAPLANRCANNLYAPKGCNTGDGHRLGLWAGGAFELLPLPIMVHPMAYHYATYCFLFVDENGERFMNEDNYIQGKCLAIMRRGMTHAWSIIDADWPEKIPASIPYGGGLFWARDHAPDEPEFSKEETEAMLDKSIRNGNAVQADTLEELAEKMGVPADTFVETVKRYNDGVAKGFDEDFGKRRELLVGIDKPPYIAMKFGPSLLAVVGGLKVGKDMGVRDEKGRPVPGLYAIGNAAGGRYGVDYPMLLPGSSHGTALTFGYLLGSILAK